MEQGVTLYNYPAGYRVWLPEGLEWDFTHSNRVAKADGAGLFRDHLGRVVAL